MRYIVCIIILTSPAALWAGWESETVASEGNVGEGCSLAADRWGRLHISYVDVTEEEVKYARYDGSGWQFETIASDIAVRGLTAIDLDAFDRPHVVFSDEQAGELVYAYRSGTAWVTEKITDGTDNLFVSIHAWGSGPHVTYAKVGIMTTLRYAYRDDGEWFTESVGSGGEFNRVFLDNGQTPHVIFYGPGNKVKHGVYEDAAWTLSDVDEGIYCDGAVGPDGKIHVSFTTVENDGLKYAVSGAGGSWEVEEVEVAEGKPAGTQITLNAAGDVFISYYSFENFDLHLATKKGATWKHELVAAGGDSGDPHSIAPGQDGYPVIAYYASVKEDLNVARYDPLTDVEITSFTARRTPDGVNIRWGARRDEGVAGYNIYRESAGEGRANVNDAFIVGRSPFSFVDRDAPAKECRYWLEVVASVGKTQTVGPAAVPPATRPAAFTLHQNVPNPVAGATTFSFELPEGADVDLAVYDAAGRKVAAVAEGYFAAGRHDVTFHGYLAPGVYVYRLDAGSWSAARKMVAVK